MSFLSSNSARVGALLSLILVLLRSTAVAHPAAVHSDLAIIGAVVAFALSLSLPFFLFVGNQNPLIEIWGVCLSDLFQLSRDSSSSSSLDGFIGTENGVALQGILNNIGGGGEKAAGVKPGLVIASPSKVDPDYFYSWTRDSALTFKALIDAFIAGNKALQPQIEDYIYAQASLQTVSNPSGSLSNGAGLGEPKFEVDGIAFTGAWGRPQRDGPALRATALIAYSRYLISSGNTDMVTNVIWPIVSNDLSYVAQYWNETTFDLWEEVQGSSFFTTAVQHRALVEGNAFAQQIGKTCDGCVSQAANVLCFLQSFWNGEYIMANINEDNGRSRKDGNTLLGSIQILDPTAGCDDSSFQPCSARALANHKVVVDSFRSIYAINAGIPENSAAAVGRYPEDTYQGGNPWYITTLAAAQHLYAAHAQFTAQKTLTITPTSLPFFTALYPQATTGTYPSTTATYAALLAALLTYADTFVTVIQTHTPSTGALAEQYSRTDGHPLSAVDLTWSYAAFLTATSFRANTLPASWSSPSQPPACPSNSSPTTPSYTGTYTPASAATACASAPAGVTTQNVTFNVAHVTSPGQTVFVVGNVAELGGWDPAKGVVLSADAYQQGYPRWWATVTLPRGGVEYKYYQGGYEGGENRVLGGEQGDCGRGRVVVDVW